MAKYRYVGDGQGVPGLPNEITDAEVKAMGDTAYPDPDAKPDENNEVKRLTFAKQLKLAVQASVYEKVKDGEG